MYALERRLLESYAAQHGRTLSWELVEEPWQLLPALHEGRGDLVAGQSMALESGMQKQAIFTMPWGISRQLIVMRTGAGILRDIDDLTSRQVAVRQSSPVWPLLRELATRHPGMDLVTLPQKLELEEILRGVDSGRYNLAVADSLELEALLPGHPELAIAFELTEPRTMAWALLPQAERLRDSVNEFLNREALALSDSKVHFDDLPQIEERGVLRVITSHSPTSFYLQNGELRGFEYDLIKRFAEQRRLRVDVVVAPSQQEMLEWLLAGRGDLVAASLPALSVRNDQRFGVSRPYNYAAPLVIGRATGAGLIDPRDLDGRRVTLAAGSAYRRLLERFHQSGIELEIAEAEPEITLEQVAQRTALGVYDLMVVDSHKARALLSSHPGLKAHFALSEPLPHSWVVRARSTQLLAAINGYLENIYRGEYYNVLKARYFGKAATEVAERRRGESTLSPYDDIVRKYADDYGFDWRLIVAQMYEESRFDPDAESTAGARGLMQVLPATAEELGIGDLGDPESGIRAGVHYLGAMRERFEDDLAFEDRLWFALAAYHAGFDRVRKARQLAAAEGLDPDRWFGNVEEALLLLGRQMQEDNEAGRGCGCRQTVAYVREIRSRYHHYVRLTQATRLATNRIPEFPFDS